MSNLEKLLKEAKEELYNEECVKEYFRLKAILDNDEEIKNLDKEMKNHQKIMCENKDNDEIYLKEKFLYENCKKSLDENPLYQNFLSAQEEVNSLLLDVKGILD